MNSTILAPAVAPWYRREPWLAVMLGAFVPVLGGFATPQRFHPPLMMLSALLMLLSLGLLARQGLFRSYHPPDGHR